jgi:hypothetical protein
MLKRSSALETVKECENQNQKTTKKQLKNNNNNNNNTPKSPKLNFKVISAAISATTG